jgi:hypothetical protein
VIDGGSLTWDPDDRIAHLVHPPDRLLEDHDARTIGRAIVGWVGAHPREQYGFLVQAPPDFDWLGTAEYRRIMGAGAVRHRDWCRLVMYGGAVRARLEAEYYVRGIAVVGAVVDTEAQAREWLAGHGIGRS